MIKAYALIEMDGCVLGQPFKTRELAETAKANLSYFGDMVSVEEIDFNDEPLSEEGEKRMLVLKDLLKDTTKLHMSKLPGFYTQSADEKVEFMINMLDEANGFPRTKMNFEDK